MGDLLDRDSDPGGKKAEIKPATKIKNMLEEQKCGFKKKY